MDEPVQFGSKEVLALRDEIKSFLFAGHDTTRYTKSATLLRTCYGMSGVRARCRATLRLQRHAIY
eukprot:2470676-Rhodomonas_salina.2